MTSAFALERKELMSLLKEASTKQESAYVDIRNCITAYGTNALPLLAEFAIDETLPWQQQLVARICYERIERKKDIERLLATDWYSHPNFDSDWNGFITGPEIKMGKIIIPDLKEAGLWYYYLELMWKMTGEDGKISKHHFPDAWISCCTVVVKDSPEERIWFFRVCAELLTIVSPPPRLDGWILPILRREEKPDSAYFLEHHMPPPVTSEPPFRLGTKIIKPAK